MTAQPGLLGLVDGSIEASTRRFQVVLNDDAVAQLDQLVATTQTLPDGSEVTHYGIVVEGTGEIEGAELASDTQRIAGAKTMPGVISRRVEVQILRTVPELWLSPQPGAAVTRAAGIHRERALFVDLAGRLADDPARVTDPRSFQVLIPAFVISELKEAFQIGFIVFLPFLIIDMVVANILLGLGMMMLSPTTIALPFKILLFVLVDGWFLIVQGLVLGYVQR